MIAKIGGQSQGAGVVFLVKEFALQVQIRAFDHVPEFALIIGIAVVFGKDLLGIGDDADDIGARSPGGIRGSVLVLRAPPGIPS